MKRSRKLESHCEELWTIVAECPYCGDKRKHRSLREEPDVVKCRKCKREYAIDYELGDEEAWLIKQGFFVNYIGERKLDIKVNVGLCISGNFWDEVTNETCIWVNFGVAKYAINIYDLKIDEVLNENNW